MSKVNRVFLAGDLNCKYPEWDANCTHANPAANLLRDVAKDNELIIRYTSSTLDIAVTKNQPKVQNIRTISAINSDHHPV